MQFLTFAQLCNEKYRVLIVGQEVRFKTECKDRNGEGRHGNEKNVKNHFWE